MYIAEYDYDPFEFSPNENPEVELPLTAGDYVLVVDNMDEVRTGEEKILRFPGFK